MKKTPKLISVFFSWQSDLPRKSTRYAIAEGLKRFKKSHSENIHIDEATRDKAGSPNIPQTILEKIGKADIFVADVSTINKSSLGKKKCPNPNVVFELGYAVQILGWERIILLFNREYGTLPDDLPFDFDRHRVAAFELTETSGASEKSNLYKLISDALDIVIQQDPKRPLELGGITEEQLMHQRDVRAMEWVLGAMHLPTIDDCIDELPYSFPYRAIYLFERVNGIVFGNSLFHINDKKLSAALRAFVRAWSKTLSRDDLYVVNSNATQVTFLDSETLWMTPEQQVAWDEISTARQNMKKNFVYILKKVRGDFPSIDLDETNRRAWEDSRD